MIKNKTKIIILASIVAISSVLSVGFDSKIELINGDYIDLVDEVAISFDWQDKFELIDDRVMLELDGKQVDITEFCKYDSENIFTYEKQVGNHIEKIAIAGEPNTKSGIILARNISNVEVTQEMHDALSRVESYFNDERTQAEQLGYCSEDGEPAWFDDAQTFLKIDTF